MDLEKKYDIDLNNKLIVRAFTHSSYVNEHKIGEDYERLEFLGDKILDFLVSEYLYVNEHLKEGEMTRIRANYVCENALCEYSKKLGFNKYLKLGKGEELTGGREKNSILADTFEAFLASIYLIYGLDKVKKIVYDTVIEEIKKDDNYYLNDYKSMLQEYLQTDKRILEYIIESEEGPSNNKVYKVKAIVDGVTLGIGKGNSKKEAEQEAAKDALSKKANNNK